MAASWADALKIYNKGRSEWCSPRRGTLGHEEVARIRKLLSSGVKNVRRKKRTKKPKIPVRPKRPVKPKRPVRPKIPKNDKILDKIAENLGPDVENRRPAILKLKRLKLPEQRIIQPERKVIVKPKVQRLIPRRRQRLVLRRRR